MWSLRFTELIEIQYLFKICQLDYLITEMYPNYDCETL